MEEIDNIQKVRIKLDLDKKIKQTLMALGFDFSLLGSHYMKDILLFVLYKPQTIRNLTTKVMQEVSNTTGHSVKSIDKDIRLAINKAYKVGALKNVSFFSNGNMPTIKQMINWLFDFFISDVAFAN